MQKLGTLKSYTVGTPMSPARWIGKPYYENWLEVLVACGGGMGGSMWYEYITEQELPSNTIITVESIDGHSIQLNTAYVVKAETVKIVFASYCSDNPNYKLGMYHVRWITPYEENEFVDRYDNKAPDRGEYIE